MKKSLPYALLAIVVAAAALLFYIGQHNRHRVLDERLSFRRRDKIPYGTWVAYKNLPALFPNASVTVNDKQPGFWDSLSTYGKKQALLIVCPEFRADTDEMQTLIKFAENGNNVFISTIALSYDVLEMLNCDVNTTDQLITYFGGLNEDDDTLTVSLSHPPFVKAAYTYPGKQLDSYFSKTDTTITTVLGYDKKGLPDFIHLRAGEGNIYVHLAPMTFTNYFLLHKENLAYYENVLSVLPPGTQRIAWDEYFLHRKNITERKDQKGWLSSLLSITNSDGKRSFAAAFWVLLLLLLVYVVMEMRRKQRYIPVIKKPRNDSLDFVKTIGRLYHDKGDHLNLSKKMAAYFLEHVRNTYKLPTSELNEQFVKALQAKTGIAEDELSRLVYFIRQLEVNGLVTESQLIAFHQQLESFYKTA